MAGWVGLVGLGWVGTKHNSDGNLRVNFLGGIITLA